jgi:hypothetical protein
MYIYFGTIDVFDTGAMIHLPIHRCDGIPVLTDFDVKVDFRTRDGIAR